MKNKSKLWGLIIGIDIVLACLVIALVLMLTLGSSDKKDDDKADKVPDETTAVVPDENDGENEDTDKPDTDNAGEDTTDPEDDKNEEDPEENDGEEENEPTPPATPSNPGGSSSNNNQGEGTDPETNVPENKPVEEEKITVSAPGSKDNCYTENLKALPTEFSTVIINKGEVVYYNIYGAQGLLLTIEDEGAYVIYGDKTYKAEEGKLSLPLTASATDPVMLGIGNSLDKRAFSLFFCQVPEEATVIESVAEIDVALKAGDMDGKTYLWTADKDCELRLWIDSIAPESAECDITVTVNGYVYTLSDFGSDDETIGKRVLSLDIDEGCEVSINVIEKNNGEANLTVKGTSEELVVPDYYDEYVPLDGKITTAKIAGETDVLYNLYGAGDMILEIHDPDAYVIYNEVTYGADVNGIVRVEFEPVMGLRYPVEVRIGNRSETRKAFDLMLSYPVGHLSNPQVIEELSYFDLSFEEGDDQGYYYSYTPTDSGKVHFSLYYMTEGVAADIIYNNNTLLETKTLSADGTLNEYGETVLIADVNAGDQIIFQVVTVPAADWTYPAVELSLFASFEYPLGTYNNPIYVENPDTVTVEAGKQTYFAGFYSDTILTVTGENALYTVECSDANLVPDESFKASHLVTAGMRQPVIFGITNLSEADASFGLKFDYPVGSFNNPEVVEELSYHESSFKEGDSLGYYYSYVAEADGTVSFWISEITEGTEGEIMVINNTTFDQFNLSEDGIVDEFGTLNLHMAVSAGDEISFHVSVKMNEETWTVPASDIKIGAAFEYPLGSENNPYVDFVPVDGVVNTTEIAGESYVHYMILGAGSKILTLEGIDGYVIYNDVTYGPDASGKVEIEMEKVLGRDPVYFIVGNAGAEAKSFKMTFVFPLGDSNNPCVIGLGDHTAIIEEGSDGYYFSYTAEKSGTFTLTIDTAACENGWEYFVNDITNYRYGDTHTSSDATLVSTDSFEAVEGDTIIILISTYDKNNSWVTPAGEVKFSISLD